MIAVIDAGLIRRNRLERLAGEIREAEEALADKYTPSHVRHFFTGQLPIWREQYLRTLESLQAEEQQRGKN